MIRVYRPVIDFVLGHRGPVILAAVVTLIVTWVPWTRLGSEFMPPLDEGTILYMPTTLPGLPVARAREILRQQDSILKSFPEVEHVWGKAGRAEHGNRSGGARHDRDHHLAQAKGAMAIERYLRWFGGGDGFSRAHAGNHECVDDADQGPHRYARDRHSHARWNQDLRTGPRRSSSGSASRSNKPCRRYRARAACLPSVRCAATTWTSTSIARLRRATASTSPTYKPSSRRRSAA